MGESADVSEGAEQTQAANRTGSCRCGALSETIAALRTSCMPATMWEDSIRLDEWKDLIRPDRRRNKRLEAAKIRRSLRLPDQCVIAQADSDADSHQRSIAFERANARFVHWLPRRIRIVCHHLAAYLVGIGTQVLLIDLTVLIDDEGHHSRVAIANR